MAIHSLDLSMRVAYSKQLLKFSVLRYDGSTICRLSGMTVDTHTAA